MHGTVYPMPSQGLALGAEHRARDLALMFAILFAYTFRAYCRRRLYDPDTLTGFADVVHL